MRLLCDEMLAGLARWLRAAGHDVALCEPRTDDRHLIDRARTEHRLLLTRDRTLSERAPDIVLLLPEPLDAQAEALTRHLGLDWRKAPFTRCLVDNTPLAPASEQALATLPEQTTRMPGPFSTCPACHRLYWPGSHVRRMAARLDRWAGFAPMGGTPPPPKGSLGKPEGFNMAENETRPFAVVTGGSSGIGYELARHFAINDFAVLIAAEDPARLEQARTELAVTGAEITTHASDLATEEGVASLYAALQGRTVDVLCVNAGVGLSGPFAETDLQRELRMIDLNVRGAVQLTKLVLQDMTARNNGKLLFTSSIAATHPAPFEAVYGATKVFLRSFAEALRNELQDTRIGVTVLMPGVTDTPFFERAEMMDTRAGTMENKDDPAVVAKAAFDALMEDRDKVYPNVKNRVLGTIGDTITDQAGARMHRALSEPGSGTANSSPSKSANPKPASPGSTNRDAANPSAANKE